jgi:hypothetical protein
MCIDNFIFNLKKNQKVEISRADFEELVKAYTEYKEFKESFNKLRFLSGISYEDLKQINWTAFSYIPVIEGSNILDEVTGGDGSKRYRVQFEGEFIKIGKENKK